MSLNYECVRELLFWIAQSQTAKSSGTINPIKMKQVYSAFESSQFTREELNTAAKYLVDEKLVNLSDGIDAKDTAPKWFVFRGISNTGYDYIKAIKDDKVWNKIKKALGSAAMASVPTVISAAAKFLL